MFFLYLLYHWGKTTFDIWRSNLTQTFDTTFHCGIIAIRCQEKTSSQQFIQHPIVFWVVICEFEKEIVALVSRTSKWTYSAHFHLKNLDSESCKAAVVKLKIILRI